MIGPDRHLYGHFLQLATFYMMAGTVGLVSTELKYHLLKEFVEKLI